MVNSGRSVVPEFRRTIFLKKNWMVFLTAGFAPVFLKKRLDLESLKTQTKAEEVRDPVPELLSLRLCLETL